MNVKGCISSRRKARHANLVLLTPVGPGPSIGVLPWQRWLYLEVSWRIVTARVCPLILCIRLLTFHLPSAAADRAYRNRQLVNGKLSHTQIVTYQWEQNSLMATAMPLESTEPARQKIKYCRLPIIPSYIPQAVLLL